jgi:hypothetical protein
MSLCVFSLIKFVRKLCQKAIKLVSLKLSIMGAHFRSEIPEGHSSDVVFVKSVQKVLDIRPAWYFSPIALNELFDLHPFSSIFWVNMLTSPGVITPSASISTILKKASKFKLTLVLSLFLSPSMAASFSRCTMKTFLNSCLVATDSCSKC